MKKFLQTALVSFVSLSIACGDAGSEGDASATDTSAMSSTESTPAPANPVMTKTIQLSASEEVPANNSTGTGTADVTYNKDTKTLTYSINYSGLTGDATMAHIHGTAAKGSNAGVAHDLTGVLKKAASGNFTDSVKIGDKIKEDSLLTGFYYFNIHTKKNPGGEIRGQIEF
ncbi:MAG: CHRD domain-containing protein [Chitinophagaceae bacterium]|nr:CHRD domain-containing protein [Chitinophagaceae bacterium]